MSDTIHEMVIFADKISRSIADKLPSARLEWKRHDDARRTILSVTVRNQGKHISRLWTQDDIAGNGDVLAEAFLTEAITNLA